MEIKIPEVGESVREALLAKWFKKSGDVVKRDEPLCEIETDKITLDLNADADGLLTISVSEGTTVAVGTKIGLIEEAAAAPETPVTAAATVPAEKLAVSSSSPSLRREMRERNITPNEVVGSGKGGRITREDLSASIGGKTKTPSAPQPTPVAKSAAIKPERQSEFSLPVPPGIVQPSAATSAVEKLSVRSEESQIGRAHV